MATLASFFTATIYAQSATFDGVNGGWQFPSFFRGPSYRAFPKSGFVFYTISPAQTVTNQGVAVTVNTIIEQLPSGTLGGGAPARFVTDSTFAQLYTNGVKEKREQIEFTRPSHEGLFLLNEVAPDCNWCLNRTTNRERSEESQKEAIN